MKTNFFAEHPPAHVPDNSRYIEVRDLIDGLTDGRMQENGITAEQYATEVVKEVEKGTVGPVWAGKDAGIFRLVWSLSPQSVFVSLGISPVSDKYLTDSIGHGGTECHSHCQGDGESCAKEASLRANGFLELTI